MPMVRVAGMSISTLSPRAGANTPPVSARPLVSASGVMLTRPVAYRFALDPTRAQRELFARYAGAARYAFNHHLARVRANLDQRIAERSYGMGEGDLTPAPVVVEDRVHHRVQSVQERDVAVQPSRSGDRRAGSALAR